MEEALEQYLVLAKSTHGKAAEALIMQAIANPNTFVFGELVDLLAASDVSQPFLDLLNIFAYGSYADYDSRRGRLPDLNTNQIRKLKMLTLASLAAESKLLSFSSLQSQLQIPSLRELEDLIIDSIYHGLLEGKLDHKLSALQIHSAFGRDIRPEQVPQLLGKLNAYLAQVRQVDSLLAAQQRSIENHRTHTQLRLDAHKEQQKKEKERTLVELNSMQEPRGRRGEERFFGFSGFRSGFLR